MWTRQRKSSSILGLRGPHELREALRQVREGGSAVVAEHFPAPDALHLLVRDRRGVVVGLTDERLPPALDPLPEVSHPSSPASQSSMITLWTAAQNGRATLLASRSEIGNSAMSPTHFFASSRYQAIRLTITPTSKGRWSTTCSKISKIGDRKSTRLNSSH